MKALGLAVALGLSLASVAAAQPQAASDPAAALSQSAGGSDVFSRAADGSVQRAGVVVDPAAAPGAAAPQPRAGLLSGRAESGAPADVPLSPVAQSAPDQGGLPLGANPLAAAGALGAGLLLGIGALLIQHSAPAAAESEVSGLAEFVVDPVVAALAAPASTAAVLTAAAPEAPTSAALAATAPAFEEALSSPAASFAQVFRPAARLSEVFVDSRMPVGTWRAISAPEQALIEGWDSSLEKALGQASLEEWLDRHPAAGVDAAGLKAKLARA